MPALFAHSARDIELQISQIEKKKIQNAGFRVKETFTFLRVLSNEGSSFCKQTKKKKKKGWNADAYKKKTGEKKTLRTSCWAWTLRDPTGAGEKKQKERARERERERESGWLRLKVKNRRDLVVPFKATKQSRDPPRLKSGGNTTQSQVPVSTRVASVRFLVNYPRGRPHRAA